MASECEWLSVFLSEARSAQEIQLSLKGLPQGMEIIQVEELDLKEKVRDASREVYRLQLPSPTVSFTFMEVWEKLQQKSELVWHRETKKGTREINVCPYFLKVQETANGYLLELDWTPGYLSPLALCSATLTLLGYPTQPHEIHLTLVAPAQEKGAS